MLQSNNQTSNFVVSVKDLRIAKLARSARVLTCNAELDAYMAAVDRNGVDSRIVQKFANALTLCMNQKSVSSKPASIKFHLAKFLNTQK